MRKGKTSRTNDDTHSFGKKWGEVAIQRDDSHLYIIEGEKHARCLMTSLGAVTTVRLDLRGGALKKLEFISSIQKNLHPVAASRHIGRLYYIETELNTIVARQAREVFTASGGGDNLIGRLKVYP